MPCPRLLLVEGPADREVVYHLFNRYGIPRGTIDVEPEEGVEALWANLDRWLRRSDLQQLGIIMDADVDLMARWDAARNRLAGLGYARLPRRPAAGGTIVHKEDEPTVGVWIMPDNARLGMLETFLEGLIPTDRVALWMRARSVVSAIPQSERLFPAEHLIKAEVHTYLAWQREPGQPLGLAIARGFLDANAPQANRLRSWLRRLFQV